MLEFVVSFEFECFIVMEPSPYCIKLLISGWWTNDGVNLTKEISYPASLSVLVINDCRFSSNVFHISFKPNKHVHYISVLGRI